MKLAEAATPNYRKRCVTDEQFLDIKEGQNTKFCFASFPNFKALYSFCTLFVTMLNMLLFIILMLLINC